MTETTNLRTVQLTGLRELLANGAQLVEVLPEEEYAWGHLPGAIHLPLKGLDASSAGRLDRTRPVAVYCWDALCDMSPRAACRLATMGFAEVYDYMPGKVDWIAHGLSLEGEWDQSATAGALARRDVATCRLHERAATIRARIESSPYGFALVISGDDEIVLGRLRSSALGDDQDAPAESLMEPGPSTVRAHVEAGELAERHEKRGFKTAVVTTPAGRLLGVVRRGDLEAVQRPTAR